MAFSKEDLNERPAEKAVESKAVKPNFEDTFREMREHPGDILKMLGTLVDKGVTEKGIMTGTGSPEEAWKKIEDVLRKGMSAEDTAQLFKAGEAVMRAAATGKPLDEKTTELIQKAVQNTAKLYEQQLAS